MSQTYSGPKSPSRRTLKELFALTGNQCAFPGCTQALVDSVDGRMVGEVCYIRAINEAGPRYDPNQTNLDRHGIDNLIVLCNIHHRVVDDRLDQYTADVLVKMKAEHENQCRNGKWTQPLSVSQMMADLPLDSLPEPGGFAAQSYMPLLWNALFVGREAELLDLAKVFSRERSAAIVPWAATVGMGGVGKTQLAAAFAHYYGQFFDGGVFWINMGEPGNIEVEIARSGYGLNLHDHFETLPRDQQVALVLKFWQNSTPKLLVFDDCRDEALLLKWRPHTGGARLLVTSRKQIWRPGLGLFHMVLETLPRNQSVALLQMMHPTLTSEYADKIAAELGDLPLALHLAGSYLHAYADAVSPELYLDQLQKTATRHWSMKGVGTLDSPTKTEMNVLNTFDLTYTRIQSDTPEEAAARALLIRAAFFVEDEPFPKDVLLKTLPSDHFRSEDVIRGLERLLSLSLIRKGDKSQLKLHRLLARFIKAKGGEQEEAEQAVIDAVLTDFNSRRAKRDHRECFPILGQMQGLAERYFDRETPVAVWLCMAMFEFYSWMGDLKGALRFAGQAKALAEKVFGNDHETTATCCHHLAGVLRSRDDLVGARAHLERALAIWGNVFDTDLHPGMAASLHELAGVLRAQGDLGGARAQLERALAIWEKVYETDLHPDVAASLHELAGVLRAQGDLGGARAQLERALAIWEKVYETDLHPDVAASLHELAGVLQTQGDLGGACAHLERALAIKEKVYETDLHPDVATSLNNLAGVLKAQGDLNGARAYLERALAILEKVYETDLHPSVAASLHELGGVLMAQGDLGGARAHLERSLAIKEKVFETDLHPSVAASLHNLAGIQQAQGDLAGAVATFEKVLDIERHCYGTNDHYGSAITETNLAYLLLQSGQDAFRAYALLKHAHEVFLLQLGPDHPYTKQLAPLAELESDVVENMDPEHLDGSPDSRDP